MGPCHHFRWKTEQKEELEKDEALGKQAAYNTCNSDTGFVGENLLQS